MKKSTLALSIAAAIGGIGMAGNALAVTGSLSGAANSSALVRNDGGIGHQLVFPYYTAQNGNATLLSITNTDTVKAKVVKVRFRGAANSDDVYDFQVIMSPGDVWSAAVTQDAATGSAKLASSDKSCTLPDTIKAGTNPEFVKLRLDGQSAAQTLEGYVEVINMADVDTSFASDGTLTGSTTAKALYNAVKHVNGDAPCTVAALEASLGQDGSHSDLTGRGLAAPTTGLTGDWIILNQNTTAAWSGSATALEVRAAGAATTGNLVFFPQILGDRADAASFTADPLITAGVLTAQHYDLPDMSTPYAAQSTDATAIANPADQADATTRELAAKNVANQYVTSDDIAAVTDIMFSQPMRRYSAVVNYTASTVTDSNGNTLQVPFATNGTKAVALYRGASPTATGMAVQTLNNVAYNVATTAAAFTAAVGTGSDYYGPAANTAATVKNLAFSPSNSRILCLTTIAGPARNTIFDREETTPGTSSGGSSISFVISPNTSTTPDPDNVYVCGEAAVVSINGNGTSTNSALSASIARSDFTATTGYENGWIQFATTGGGATNGLPIIGQSFIRAANGSVNYGFGFTNKVTR